MELCNFVRQLTVARAFATLAFVIDRIVSNNISLAVSWHPFRLLIEGYFLVLPLSFAVLPGRRHERRHGRDHEESPHDLGPALRLRAFHGEHQAGSQLVRNVRRREVEVAGIGARNRMALNGIVGSLGVGAIGRWGWVVDKDVVSRRALRRAPHSLA